MQTQPDDVLAASGQKLAARGAAFGLAARSRPPYRDTRHPGGRFVSSCLRDLDTRETGSAGASAAVESAEHASKRVREQRDGDAVLLSVDFVPTSGYLLSAPEVGRILISPDGTELLCDPEPECAEWTTLIPAQALPLAATLERIRGAARFRCGDGRQGSVVHRSARCRQVLARGGPAAPRGDVAQRRHGCA